LRKPSDTKPSLAPLDLTFFTDRDLGKTLPNLLREHGLTVERYFDHFEEGRRVPDNQWLRYAAERAWVALSHDNNIRLDAEAVRTVMEHSGRLFILRGKVTSRELAAIFLQAEHAVAEILVQHDRSFIANVRRTALKGGVVKATAEVMLTLADWRAGRRFMKEEPEISESDEER
jgi:hypothetical protein